MDDRIVELEIKVAFQEKAIRDLDEVLARYTEIVDVLVRELAALRERVSSQGVTEAGETIVDEPPPHY